MSLANGCSFAKFNAFDFDLLTLSRYLKAVIFGICDNASRGFRINILKTDTELDKINARFLNLKNSIDAQFFSGFILWWTK